jgi:hypothetical protein
MFVLSTSSKKTEFLINKIPVIGIFLYQCGIVLAVGTICPIFNSSKDQQKLKSE